MGVFFREKKDKVNIQKFLQEAFSLYAWCMGDEHGPNGVGETFKEYFGSNEDEREKLRMRMYNFNVYVLKQDDAYITPLVETIKWCIHNGDRIIWKKEEEDGETWTFHVTYTHKHTNEGRKPVIGFEYDFEEVWKIKYNGKDMAVADIADGKDIRMSGGMESGDFEMPGKEIGKIIKKKNWNKGKLPLPDPF